MLYRKWTLREGDAAKSAELAKQTGAGRLLCDVLVARGIDTPEAVQAMLDDTTALPSPFLLQDMDKAARRIHRAIAEEEPMVIFGDYDVDGITATALLYTYLESQGANVFYKLPSRSDEGYGLSPVAVEQIAGHGISLIVTVDTGTSAFDAAERAKELGVDIVMTDHHLPQNHLPEAVAVVNPHREDDDSPFDGFSGVGVAFMLAAALEGCPADEMLPLFGDFVAIGTVADVMKLTGLNRTLVRAGLATLRDTERPGLAALIEACGWSGRDITVENISYGIAPRLNAAGRMDDATEALRLLLSDDEETARAIVEQLQEQNTARQKAEAEITETIVAQVEADAALQRARVLVVWGEGWHQGVIGIVASRLVEKFAKPAIVIALEGEADAKEGRGSGRSVAGFSLYGAIASCEDILIRYGGHDLAAGLSIKADELENFRRRVNEWAAEHCAVPALPEMVADAPVQLDRLQVADVQGLAKLAPCGSGNPAPRFLLQNAVLDAVYPVSEGKHCRLRLRQGKHSLYAVLFGTSPASLAYPTGSAVDALVALSVYEGKAGAQISARLLEMRPAGLANTHAEQSALFEGFSCGTRLSEEQKTLLLPTRDDTAAVYRALRGEPPFHCNDLRPAFAALGETRTGRILASLAALEELGLVRKNETTSRYETVPVQTKRDLSESLVLKRLEV